MNILEMNEIGKFIRKTRKERGLRLEDLSDEHISTATISNIERGVPHVNKDKVLYLMSKLGLDLSEIPEMIEKDSESLESMQVKFTAVETLIQIRNPQRALQLLSELSQESHSRHQATVHYLRGRIFSIKKDWRKAERELSEAIRLSFQDPYSPKTNLEAASYYALAICRATQKDWEQALKYVERGLEAFQESKSSYDQIQYMLLTSQIEYLDKLGRSDEALRHLDELWKSIEEIHNKDLILRMYALRADLLRRMKLYQDALRYAREGIQLAVSSKDYEETYKLWTVLGTAYMQMSQWEDAETCFEFALEIREHVTDPHEVIRTYCSLGHVYLVKEKADQARDILKQALDWSEKYNDSLQLNTALLLMGQLMKKLGHHAEAIEYFKKSAQVASKYKFKQKLYLSYYELANCYEQIGNEEGFKEATELMFKAQKELKPEDLLLDIS